MLVVPLILAASAGPAEPPAPPSSGGAQIASAQVTAKILRAAVVRQSDGLQPLSNDVPRPRLTRRDGQLLIEFE